MSAVTNLDDEKLKTFYTTKLDIDSSRKVNTAVTRAEFVKMIFLASEINLDGVNTNKALSMSDVKIDENFKYIAAAFDYGIVAGQTDGAKNYFRPNDTIMRSEAAKIFVRVASLKKSEVSHIFHDVSSTMTLASYIESAYNNCLLHGRNTRNGEPIRGALRLFEPFSPITIAETAKVLYNMTH